jgi:hypothetical protein
LKELAWYFLLSDTLRTHWTPDGFRFSKLNR